MNTIKFAGFIMTYERAETLIETIEILFVQTVTLDKILIVDNSSSYETQERIALLNNPRVVYHRVGYNSGPAGAAEIGLRILASEGYDWIYWGDDDDPPLFDDTFEILLKTALSNNKCGCVGNVGQYFNKKNGLMVRVSNAELEGNGAIEVDNIAGGMCKIVNAAVCTKATIFPDKTLFYGFEELDFDLRLQQAGYVLLVEKELYKRHRVYWNRTDITIKKGQKKEENRLRRDYYSTRNSLIIIKKHKLFSAFVFTILRSFYKIIMGFKFGLKYGLKNAKVIFYALFHFCIGKKGLISI
jgi:GT2 family glycosyltransferase